MASLSSFLLSFLPHIHGLLVWCSRDRCSREYSCIFLLEVSIPGWFNYNCQRVYTLDYQKLLKEHSSGTKDQRNQQIIGFSIVLAILLWTCPFQHLSFETGLPDLVC